VIEQGETVIRSRAEHTISRRNIDPDALKVLYHLSHHGYTAYLVGGGVRDLLLGRTPKDFDVGTSAHPNLIKKLFRNCFLIGRRFRLAHIKFGAKVIETSTFRKMPTDEGRGDAGDLFHYRDNTFGTPEEDARRRDFTINGLFYDIKTFSVIDHVGGLKDLDHRLIRSIGDPSIRFREDPVRMVRAVRFASRLGFTIEPTTGNAILEHHGEILKAAPSRMLEEIYRLFAFQSGEEAFRLLRRTRLMSVLFPEIDIYVDENGQENSPLWKFLAALDGGQSGLPEPTPVLMWGSLYYLLFVHRVEELQRQGRQVIGADVAEDLLKPVARRFQIPKAVLFDLIHAFDLQRWMEQDPGRSPSHSGHSRFSPHRVMMNPAFRSALALYRLSVAARGGDAQALHGWLRLLE
jgi:poly(A) polymerase